MKMFKYKPGDVVEAFECSSNINSALKKMLKNDIEPGDPAEKVVKTLKTRLEMKKKDMALRFIEDNVPQFEEYIFLWADYALREDTGKVFDVVVEKYAEDFNKTYEDQGQKIKVLDKEAFKKIGKEAIALIGEELERQEMPASGFMKNVLIFRIFDKPVIDALKIN